MKTPRSSFLLLLFVAGLLFALPRAARADVSFEFFYDSLAPHGQWIEVGDYGYCWRPQDVDDDWAPYSDGYWTYTDAGWTWVSYEDWGGITYHYGRWTLVEDEGWCWVPGTEWGPAWVSWRNSDDYVGWAPLPPEARWQPSVGFSVWVDNSYDIGPGYYNFCHSYDFGVPFLRPCILPRRDNVTIINKTVNITNITYNNISKVVYNGGPDFKTMNRRSRRPIPALKLVKRGNMDDLGDGRNRRGKGGLLHAEQRGNQLEVVAPTITQGDDAKALKPKKIAKVVSKDKVNKGWASVKDPEQRRAIKQQMEQQTRNLSPETAPAKPVQVADLQVLPEKADPNAPSPAKTGKDKAKGNDKKIAADTGDSGRTGKDARTDQTAVDASGANAQADAGKDKRTPGKAKGGNKADATGAPVAATERDPSEKQRAKSEGEGREKGARENAANRQADRDGNDQKKNDLANTDERAARRRALEKEMARDSAELAAARARRQQEATNDPQEEKRRERQQRPAVSEERARQRNDDDNRVVRQRERQSDGGEALRQQAGRDRQIQAQREAQQQRAQRQQQQQQQQQFRALENQRAAQQQRQMQIQRQQQQQIQQRQQAGGGGGGGRGAEKRQQSDEDREQQKKQRRF